eukprot:10680291-Karenia_brevis.AAC.1
MENQPKDKDGGDLLQNSMKKAGRSSLRAALFEISDEEQGEQRRLEEEADAVAAQLVNDALTQRAL